MPAIKLSPYDYSRAKTTITSWWDANHILHSSQIGKEHLYGLWRELCAVDPDIWHVDDKDEQERMEEIGLRMRRLIDWTKKNLPQDQTARQANATRMATKAIDGFLDLIAVDPGDGDIKMAETRGAKISPPGSHLTVTAASVDQTAQQRSGDEGVRKVSQEELNEFIMRFVGQPPGVKPGETKHATQPYIDGKQSIKGTTKIPSASRKIHPPPPPPPPPQQQSTANKEAMKPPGQSVAKESLHYSKNRNDNAAIAAHLTTAADIRQIADSLITAFDFISEGDLKKGLVTLEASKLLVEKAIHEAKNSGLGVERVC